jgi:hypothetical protein
MAKIIKLETKMFDGNPSTTVELDNGVSGYLQKESTPGLQVGDEVSSQVVDYVSKGKGRHSNLVTLQKVAKTPVSQSVPTFTPVPLQQFPVNTEKEVPKDKVFELKVEASIRLAEVILEAFFNDKIDTLKAIERHKEWRTVLEGVIDELASR